MAAYSLRVCIDTKMPREVEVIASQYNITMDRLSESLEKEKELDTINWIAIGRQEYEISRAITALAAILRYGIDNSNGIVTIREEYEWLKQYLLLQQTRLKDGFESHIQIPPELMETKVHKLLIQPFVENRLQIRMEDNGRGMPQQIAESISRGLLPDSEEKHHIGLKNAVFRIRLYYEDQAQIRVESREGEYIRIFITLPVIPERKEERR